MRPARTPPLVGTERHRTVPHRPISPAVPRVPVAILVGILTLGLVGVACSTPTAPPASSVSSSTTPPNVYDAQRTAGVAAALAALSRAVTAGDTARIDELLDPSATATFRTALHTAAGNLSLPDARTERTDPVPAVASTENSEPAPTSTEAPGSATSGVPGSVTSAPSSNAESSTPTSSSAAAQPSSRGTGLRLTRFAYQVAPTEEAETLVPPEIQRVLDAAGSSDSWVAPVELHYALGGARLPGVAEPEITLDSQMVMARYDDSWRIVGDGSLLDSSPRPTQLWDLPGLAAADVATAGGASVIASYPGTAATVGRVSDLLPGAVDAVTSFWGPGWARRAVVVATGDVREFSSLAADSTTDVAAAAAATTFDRIDTTTHTALGQRIVLTPAAADLQTPALGVVLRHELTHVAVRGITSPGAPLWITEGVPEFVGRQGTYVRFADAAPELAERIRDGRVPAGLPGNRDFAIDSASAQIAYQSGWSVAAYVAGRYGPDKLKKLYQGVAASDDVKRQDAAIVAALGVNRAELVRDWQGWLRDQVR